MFFKCEEDLAEILTIIGYGKYGYCKYLKEIFGMDEYRVIEEDDKTDELIKYLDKIIGKRLLKEDQKELIDIVNLRDSRNRQQKSIGQLNEYFKANKLKYLIISKKSGSVRYWEIINDIV